MGVSTTSPEEGIAVITVDFPPVNALPVQGWYDLAAAVRAAGSDPGVRCVVLAATGRGFNAGADIKEMQRTEGYTALVGTNRGCYEAFAAVYDWSATPTRSWRATTPPSGCRSWTGVRSARPPTWPGWSPST
jgi:enoyl-CoA hydratase